MGDLCEKMDVVNDRGVAGDWAGTKADAVLAVRDTVGEMAVDGDVDEKAKG